MVKRRMASSPSRFWSFLDPLTGADKLRIEKSRLEAFLDAMPGQYCGFAQDGAVIYSSGFCRLIGLETVKNLADVQNCLATSDAAALEGQWDRLERTGQGFTLTARHAEKTGLSLRLSGTRGIALDGRDRFDILWIEDVTTQQQEHVTLQQKLDSAEREKVVFEGMIDSLPRLFWRRGAGSELQWVNRAYAEAFGKDAQQIIAEQTEITTAGKNRSAPPKDMAKQALATGEAQTARSYVIIKGQRKMMLLNEIPLANHGGTVGFALDLTREEELERELLRERASTKGMLEQMRTAISIYSADQRMSFYNSAYVQLWGLEEEWLNKRPKIGEVLERLREQRKLPEQADFKKFKDHWAQLFNNIMEPEEDIMYLPNDTVLRRVVVPHSGGEKASGLMFMFEDVTSRLALESSYNTLVAVQKETLDNLAEGIAVFGGDGRLKFSNPAYARLWNIAPETLENEPHISVLSERMAAFFAPDDKAVQKKIIQAMVHDRAATEGQFSLSDGRSIDYTAVPLPDGGKLVSFYDVTATVQVQHALEEKNAALETAERLKLDFLANVSYQLRTPLSAIMGFAEILSNQFFGPINDKQKEYTQGIEEAGQRLLSLIDDILDLSTIEAGYLELHKKDVDVRAMLQGMSDLIQDWARKEKINLRLSMPDNLPPLQADERRLKQILLNLLRNAINHTPEGGEISLSAHHEGDKIMLRVSDTGPGIADQDHQRIFEPFERGSNAPESGVRGAGLGLSLVKNIAQLHGGSVTLDAKAGKGAAFIVSLPIHPSSQN